MQKKFTITLGLCIIASTILFTGFRSGESNNYSGSDLSEVGCGSCHGPSTPSVAVAIQLDSAGRSVSHFTPGRTYTVNLTFANATLNILPKFGFQLTAVQSKSMSPVQAGTFNGATLPAGTRLNSVLGGITVFEQTISLSPSTGIGDFGSLYKTSVEWTAPAWATDSVVFCAVACLVDNNDSANAADIWYARSQSYVSTAATAVAKVDISDKIIAYPIPANDKLRLQFPGTGGYRITVYDVAGRPVLVSDIPSSKAELPVAQLPSGTYQLFITDGQQKGSITFLKD